MLPFLGVSIILTSAAASGVQVRVGPAVETKEAAFFAFDFDSVPFRRNLHLTMVPATKHPEPVLRRGPEGSPDEMRAEFYGSVIKIDGKFRMWYCGLGFDDPARRTPEEMKSWCFTRRALTGCTGSSRTWGWWSFEATTAITLWA
jgi:hypothetical protein